MRGDRHDHSKLAPFDDAGDHAGDDVVGLDEPGLLAFEAVEGAGAEQQDDIAALGFEGGERVLHAFPHAPSRQLDDAAVLQPGDQRRLARIGGVARVDLGMGEPIEDAVMDAPHRRRHMPVNDRHHVGPRRLADCQRPENSLAHGGCSDLNRRTSELMPNRLASGSGKCHMFN